MNAVITGASRGIGFEVARIYAHHGFNLFLNARKESSLRQATEKLQSEFSSIRVEAYAADLADRHAAEAFGKWIKAHARSIDVLVNNAGSFVPGRVSDEPEGALEEMIAVNLYSAYYVTRSLLQTMHAAGSGHIFNICSIAALQAYPNGGAYSISKFALLGFTKNLRAELKDQGIKVTAVIPGAAYTDSWKGFVEPDRIMEAADIAKMIYAASELSPQATVEEIIMRPQLGDL